MLGSLLNTYLQLQEMFLTGKHVREGVHFAVGEREVMGCDLRAAELHERHDGPGAHTCRLLVQVRDKNTHV